MLEFWFNPQISVLKKLALLIAVAVATIVLYRIQPLGLDSIIMFLGTGVIFLICRYCKIHFANKKPIGLLYRVLTWIPIALVLGLAFVHIQNGDILIPGAQGICFMVLAICIFSPLSLFNQKLTNKKESS